MPKIRKLPPTFAEWLRTVDQIAAPDGEMSATKLVLALKRAQILDALPESLTRFDLRLAARRLRRNVPLVSIDLVWEAYTRLPAVRAMRRAAQATDFHKAVMAAARALASSPDLDSREVDGRLSQKDAVRRLMVLLVSITKPLRTPSGRGHLDYLQIAVDLEDILDRHVNPRLDEQLRLEGTTQRALASQIVQAWRADEASLGAELLLDEGEPPPTPH